MLDLSRELCNKIVDGMLVCPICKSRMSVSDDLRSLICMGELDGSRRHCFDGGAGGYVSLCRNGGGGDSKDAVRARSGFLGAGYYSPAADALVETVAEYVKHDSLVIDAGCGEGYYSCEIAKCGFSVAGFDLSKFATDAAAKRAKREELGNAFFGVASVFELPIADKSADAVVNIFAPCVENEYSRVLRDGGYLIIACAGPDHLLGLKRAIYNEVHRNDTRADMPNGLQKINSVRVKYDIDLDTNDAIKNLFAMTPYYWKTSQDDVKKLDSLDTLHTEIDVILEIYQKI